MNKKTCTVDGCDRKAKVRGWCDMHYRRWVKHGNPAYEADKKCIVDGCDRPHKAKGMCKPHYNRNYYHTNPGSNFDLTCSVCGAAWVGKRKDGRFCPKCKPLAISISRSPENLGVYDAIRTGSDQEVLDAIFRRCKITESGCWEWQGYLNANGYGRVATGRSGRGGHEQTHRVTFEYATGIKPGGMVVHHKCAIRACCNPDHLQLATQNENAAEMHARRSYEARIKSLEDALKEVAPDHPLLAA